MKGIWCKVKGIGGKRIVGIGGISLAIRFIVGGVISAGVIVGWTPSTGKLVSNTDGIEVPSRIIRSSDGNFIIFYYNVPVPLSINGSNDFDLYAAKVDINGNFIWGGPEDERLISDRPRLPSLAWNIFFKDLFYPRVVSDNEGGAVVAWVEREKWTGDPEAEHIFAKRIDANGFELWTVDIEGPSEVGDNILIDVVRGLTPDGQSATWVVWEVQEYGCCGYKGRRILAKRVDDNGGLVDINPIIIRDNIVPSGILDTWVNEVVATGDGEGGLICAWTNYEKYEASTTALSFSSLEESSPSFPYESIEQILKANVHDLIKTFFDNGYRITGNRELSSNPGVIRYSIYGQRIDKDGNRVWPEEIFNYGKKIVDDRGNERFDLRAVSGPDDDGIFLLWAEANVYPNLFIQSVDNNGNLRYISDPSWELYGKPFIVNEIGGGRFPSLVKVDPTNVIVAWSDLRHFVEPTTLTVYVYAQKIDMTTGDPQWPTPSTPYTIPIAVGSGIHGLPSVTEDGAGGAYIMWHDLYIPEDETTTLEDVIETADVSIGHIRSNGTLDIPNFTFSITGGQGLGDIIYDGVEGAIVSWSDTRAISLKDENPDLNRIELYAQRVIPFIPTPLPPPQISDFNPKNVDNDNRYSITITGVNFFAGASVIFTHIDTGYIVPCYDVNISEDGTTITCMIAVFRVETGEYYLTVTNPDGQSDTGEVPLNVSPSPSQPYIQKDVRYNATAQTLTYYIYFGNEGGRPVENIEVRETIPPGTNLVSYTPPPNMMCSLSEDSSELICWNGLEPYSEYLLTVIIDISPLIPPVTIDNMAVLHFPSGSIVVPASFTIYPPAHSGCSWFSCLSFPFDPNEKQISPMEFVTVDTTLTMRIYFENIGTAPAKDIFITDTLDPFLDEHTLREISDGGVYDPRTRTITWVLLNRNLQPHESDFVSFRIMPRKDTPRGTWISNKATIVFDTQPPMDTPLVSVYIGPPPDWDVLYILKMVRDMLISAKRSVEENDPQNPFYGLKNKGSVIGKLNSAIISVSNAIDSYIAGKMHLTENHIDTTINVLNALRNFVSSQAGKTISSGVASMIYYRIDTLIFLLETAKSLM